MTFWPWLEKVEADPNAPATDEEIRILKQHLRNKYKHYSEGEIDKIIQKFIGEYLQNMDNSRDEMSEKGVMEDDPSLEDNESRASLASHVDWNDKKELEKYCAK